MSHPKMNANLSHMLKNARKLEMRLDHLYIYCQAAQKWCLDPKPSLDEFSDMLVHHPEFLSSPYRLAQFFYDSKSPKSSSTPPRPDPPTKTKRIRDEMTPEEYREWLLGDWKSD